MYLHYVQMSHIPWSKLLFLSVCVSEKGAQLCWGMLSAAGAAQHSQALTLCSIYTKTNAHGNPLNWEVPAEGSGLCSRRYHRWTMRCRGFLPIWKWEGTQGNSVA